MQKHKFSQKFMFIVAILIAVVFGFISHQAYAQEAPAVFEEITDQVVLKALSEGDFSVLQEVTVAETTEEVMGYSIRHHWSYGLSGLKYLQVYVNNTTPHEFTDFQITAELKNGDIVERLISANLSPEPTLFLKDGSNNDPSRVHIVPSDGGRSDSEYSYNCIPPMVTMNRWDDGITTYPVVANLFSDAPIQYRIVGLTDWVTVHKNVYHSFRLDNVQQGTVEVKLEKSDTAATCLAASWDWNYREQQPVGVSISDPVIKVGQTFTLPVIASNLMGIRGFDGKICYDPSVVKFEKIDRSGPYPLTRDHTFHYEVNNGCVNFVAFRDTAFTPNEDAGNVFNLVLTAIGKDKEKSPLTISELYFSPQRAWVVQNGSVTLENFILKGQVSDKSGNPIIGTSVTLTTTANVTQTVVDPNGIFVFQSAVTGRHEIAPVNTNIDPSRIGVGDVIRIIGCVVTEGCFKEEADPTEDGEVHVDDVLCLSDTWVGKKTTGCKIGWKFSPTNQIFENLTEDQPAILFKGAYIGDMATPAVVTASAENTPVVEFLDDKIVEGEVSEIRLRVTGNDLRAISFVLNMSDVEIVNVTSQFFTSWEGNRVMVFNLHPVNEMVLTLHVVANAGAKISAEEVNTEYADMTDAASVILIVGPGTTPIIRLWLPSVHSGILDLGEEEMPILEPDQQ